MDVELLRAVIREELQSVKAAKTLVVPIPLKDAAELCQCNYRWLLERVQSSEIRAFRPAGQPHWRVYVADVVKFLTKESNIKPQRLQRAA